MNLSLVYAPDPIFQKTASAVTVFDESLKDKVGEMFRIMYDSKAVGLGANMVGLLERIVVIDLQDEGFEPLTLINPRIIKKSTEVQTYPEGSVSFPDITANITRPSQISVLYQDLSGTTQTLNTEGWLAQVVQHEIDYLDGIVFLDYLPKQQQRTLMKKYLQKRNQSL